MKAVIIGGGIAGLASALALTQHGWKVEVIERAPVFTEIGAGLSLWPNALRALDALGVGEVVRGLEQQYDSFREAEAAGTSLLAGDEPLPTGEEIGQQFEQFLAGLDDDQGESGWTER